VEKVSKSFVLVADEVFRLQTGRGPECEFFQSLARAGHARGAAGVSQQGYYAFTPAGDLLASDNTRDPERAVRMMRAALARWERVPRDKRAGTVDASKWPRAEDSYPADGLVLRQYTRDLGEKRRALGDMDTPWNTDAVWFSAAEARRMVPAGPKVGDKHPLPDALVRRLARIHLIDSVLGQSWPFHDSAVTRAGLTAEVREVGEAELTLRLTGSTRAKDGRRGMELELLGRAVYDRRRGRFRVFDLVATGTRTGTYGPAYIRNNTPEGAIGFAFRLAGDAAADRAAPGFLPAYGWR
jgi:hypothetical protein